MRWDSQALLWAAVAAAGLASCRSLDTDVVLDGELTLGDCRIDTPWYASFATFSRTTDGEGILRFQSAAGPLDDFDNIVFTLTDAREAAERLGEPLQVVPLGVDGPVHGSIAFPESCPETVNIATTLRGTLTFERFDGSEEGRVIGSFEVDVLDGRDPEVVYATGLIGEFDFESLRYPPYQVFGVLTPRWVRRGD